MSQVHKERRVVAERGVCWGEKEQNSVTMAWRHVDASGERAESGGGGETQGRGSGRRAAGTSAGPPQAPNRIQTASTPHPPRSALRGRMFTNVPRRVFPRRQQAPGLPGPFRHPCPHPAFVFGLLFPSPSAPPHGSGVGA